MDEYLYEEPIEKARHYLQCYLAPWRFFPFADDTERCAEVGLTGEACTSRAVCEKLRAQGEQCKSDTLRDQLKFEMLNKIQRKNRYLYRNTNPPETWYDPDRCNYLLSFFPAPRCTIDEAGKTVCPNTAPPSLDGGGTTHVERQEDWARYSGFKENEPDLDSQPSDVGNEVIEWGEHVRSLESKNSFPGVVEKVNKTVEQIIAEYRRIRKAEFVAGKGIRPQQYLIGWLNHNQSFCGEAEGVEGNSPCCTSAPLYGRTLEGCGDSNLNRYFYFSTEDVITPAVVLLQKMQAATQAQFDLAQQAYKYPADQSAQTTFNTDSDEGGEDLSEGGGAGDSGSFTSNIGRVFSVNTGGVSSSGSGGTVNAGGCTSVEYEGYRSTIATLPAPWEDLGTADQNRAVVRNIEEGEEDRPYTLVPQKYIRELNTDGTVRTHPQEPRNYAPEYSLNRWYKNIIELYEHSFTQPQPQPYSGEAPVVGDGGQDNGGGGNNSGGGNNGGNQGGGGNNTTGLVKSQTIPGVFCKEQYMCDQIDNGELNACVNRGLSATVSFAGEPIVVTSTNRDQHTANSYHYRNQAVDLRTNGVGEGKKLAMQQALWNQPDKAQVFGPYPRYCYNGVTGRQGDCANDGSNHIHYACQ